MILLLWKANNSSSPRPNSKYSLGFRFICYILSFFHLISPVSFSCFFSLHLFFSILVVRQQYTLKSNLSPLLTHSLYYSLSLNLLSFCNFLHIISFLFSHPWLAATSALRPCNLTNFIAMRNLSIFVLRQLLLLHGMKIACFY